MKKFLCALLSVIMIAVLTLPFAGAANLTNVNIATLISDKDNWDGTMNEPTASGQTEWGSDFILLKTGAIKSAAYMGKTYRNFQLDFKLNVTWPEDAGDWGSILSFRDNTPGLHIWEATPVDGKVKQAYGLYFYFDVNADNPKAAGQLSVSRWVNNDGDTGPENLGEKAVYTNFDLNGKEHIYRLVCEDVSNGVHIVVYMDGKKVIDFVDTSSKAIKQDGGIMLMNHGPRSAKLSVVKSSEMPKYTDGAGSTSSVKPVSSASTGNSSAAVSSAAASETGSQSQSAVISEESSLTDNSSDMQSRQESLSQTSSSDNGTGTEPEEDSNLTAIIIIVATVVILGGGATAAYIIMKKKKA